MATATESPRPTVGPIEPGILYPLAVISARLNFGRHAMRAARRAGLKVKYAHGRAFVLGSDAIDYIERCGQATH